MIPALACIALPLLSGCPDYVRDAPKLPSLVAHQAAYNGKTVSVTGRVKRLDEWASKTGLPEELFTICEGSTCIRVYMRTHSAIHDGELVTVRGTYYQTYRFGRYTFHNEIEGTEVLPRE